MPDIVHSVLEDLRAEGDALDGLLVTAGATTDPGLWARATPAAGWTVAHQIAHLAWTDRRALLSAHDEDTFHREAAAAAEADPHGFVDEGAEAGAAQPPAELLAHWRTGRAELLSALAARPPGRRLAWYGPPISVAGMASARIMETWAHGEDIADALGIHRAPTGRLRHVVHLGVRTRDFACALHGITPPAEPFRVELTAPDGTLWTHGPKDAAQRVTGDALDFCLLVTQRRHRADLRLHAEGADADRWLGIAQAFAGPPGTGRPPRGETA